MRGVSDVWNVADIELAARVMASRRPGQSMRSVLMAIAKGVGRSFFAVEARYRRYGDSFNGIGARREGASGRGQKYTHVAGHVPLPGVLAERDAHAAALDRRDLTAQVFGDPPPGYSALDRLRAKAAQAVNPPTVAGYVRGVSLSPVSDDSSPSNPRSPAYPQAPASSRATPRVPT